MDNNKDQDYFNSPSRSTRPGYMAVGNGTISESARQLTQMLDDGVTFDAGLSDAETLVNSNVDQHDIHRPRATPGNAVQIDKRAAVASHIMQLHYNQNKTTLSRAITKTVDTLKRLQEMNAAWPAHYPSVQRPDSAASSPTLEHRPTLKNAMSTHGALHMSPRPLAKRAETMGEASSVAESSSAAAKRPVPEPRLVSPQLARDFSVLKIDLKMGAVPQAELVHSLEKSAISALLDGQIGKTIRHLHSIRDRIEDTSSKVLITGDLNAGKSTFCNALLRRKVLPEDQQPCTSIFCEVLDVRENAGVEEVHAIPVGHTYNRKDERTYQVYGLDELENIVSDNDHWTQCKIYVRDIRAVDESLLNNGVVDIALIDAPGLNHDSLITTANFAKQEEIDVVVFVVSAANHFTQSAKEFVFNAAREKAYIFMVVNGFDTIKDKERCKETILKQVIHLSPTTFKESSELVHFVASNDIPVKAGPGGGGDGDDDDPDKKGKGKGKSRENMQDFAELEASLRRFVLEKRARSKLAPAKTYLLNLTSDLDSLANVNREVAQSELERVSQELSELEPQLQQSKKATSEGGDGTDGIIEGTVTDVYDHTRQTLKSTIENISTLDFAIDYPGIFGAYAYAEDLKHAMLDKVVNTVSTCEGYARTQTVSGVNAIKSLGILHLGNAFPDFTYKPENMFRRKKDLLARQVDFGVEFFDFFDFSGLWERQEKAAGTSMAITVAGVVGTRLIGGVGWVDSALGAVRVVGISNTRKLVVPGLIAAVLLATAYSLASIPTSLPRRLSAKLAAELSSIDYTHANAARISAEVRRALKFPADALKVGLKRNLEQLTVKREDTAKVKGEAERARKYFVTLVREAEEISESIRRVDLEGVALNA